MPNITLEDITDSLSKYSRMAERAEASSEILSAMMSRAPARAAEASGTSLSAFANFEASASQSPASSNMKSASGSRPRSFAIEARVRRLGLKGRYMSSSSVSVSAASIFDSSSEVSCPRSPSEFFMDLRLSSTALSLSSQSRTAATATSSSEPVASFLYLAMKGTVAPSDKSFAAASIWRAEIPSSAPIFAMCLSFIFRGIFHIRVPLSSSDL